MELNEYKKLLQDELESVNSLYRNCKRQDEALEDENAEKFLKLIEQRDEYIERVKEIEQILKNTDFKETSELENYKIEISQKSKKILEMDKNNRAKADKLMQELGKKIKRIREGKKVINQGYNKQTQYSAGAGIYFDMSIGIKKR